MKTVLLTGGTGFIGSHVVEAILKNTDWNITILDRLDETSTPHRLADMDIWEANKSRVKFVFWDLKSPINSFTANKLGAPNYVLHLAASTHVDRSITDPTMFVMDNVVGTLNLLNWAKEVKRTEVTTVPVDEQHPYGTEIKTISPIEKRQHPEKFIPMTISKIAKGEKNIIHANKDLTKAGSRYYIHARNVASALLFLLQSDAPMLNKEDRNAGIYNIVGEKELDNLEIVKLIHKCVNEFTQSHLREVNPMNSIQAKDVPLFYELVDFHSSRPGHDLRYALDGAKLAGMGFGYAKTLEELIFNGLL
jgi:dTDP-glucose 4,6-dehydratase